MATPALEQLLHDLRTQQAQTRSSSSNISSAISGSGSNGGKGGVEGSATVRKLLWRSGRESRGYIMDRWLPLHCMPDQTQQMCHLQVANSTSVPAS